MLLAATVLYRCCVGGVGDTSCVETYGAPHLVLGVVAGAVVAVAGVVVGVGEVLAVPREAATGAR